MSQLDFLRDLMETEYKNQFVKAHIIVPSLTE